MELVKIAQINAQRSAAAAANLELLMKEKDIDILCIQEPYCFKGIVRGYTSSGLRVVQPKVQAPWVAAVVKEEKVDIFQLPLHESCHIACFSLLKANIEFYFLNVYCQFSQPIEPFLSQLERIMSKIGNKNIIITMDSNAKAATWFASENDERGRHVQEFVLANNLAIINEPSRTYTYSTVHGESNIDITMISSNLIGQVEEWTVSPDCTTSDHNIITFVIKVKSSMNERKIIKKNGYNFNKADWNKFNELLNNDDTNDIISKIENSKADDAARWVSKKLDEICESTMPKRKKPERTIPWWNEDLTKLRKKANCMKKQLARTRRLNFNDQIELHKKLYKRARNKYVAEIRKRKTETWRKFVTEEGNKDPWSIVYKIVREKINKPNYLCSLELEDGTVTTSWKETVQALLNKMVPKDEKINETEEHKQIKEENSLYRNLNLEPNISQAEIEMAVKKCKNNKAPGLDGLKAEVIKAAWNCNKNIFLTLINKCLWEQHFPKNWKTANLKILLKNKDKDVSKTNSYRPIALLPVMGKIFERIILNRIDKQYEDMNMNSPWQYGFKSGKSTEDALLRLRSCITACEEKYIVAIFIDIEGAFDNIWWPFIKNRLTKANCSTTLIKIVDNYFKRRKIKVQDKKQELTCKMEKGCPQGSIIGPKAWNWCLDELLKNVEEEFNDYKVQEIAYADDLVFIVKGDSRRQIENAGIKLSEIIKRWCSRTKLKTSKTKTVAMIMKGKLDSERLPKIIIEGVKIKYVKQVKYLGIIVNRQMNFISHAQYIRNKLVNYVMSIKRIVKQEWGIKAQYVNILYKAAALPIVTYGAAMWFDKVSLILVKRHLTSAQRSLLLLETKACRTTATAAMQVIAGHLPIDLEIIKQGIMGYVRRNRNVKWREYEFKTKENEKDIEINKELEGILKELYRDWQERWNTDRHGRETYKFIKRVDFKQMRPWFRPNFNCMFLITGYGPINFTLYKRGASETMACPICEKIETVEHMMYECTGYNEIRYAELISYKNDWNKLINIKDDFKKFAKFADKLFEIRKEINTQGRTGSASSGLGTGTASELDG